MDYHPTPQDGGADICDDMAKDKDYAAAIGVVGLHYPSDYANYSSCRTLGFGVQGGSKPTWASEAPARLCLL